MKSNWLIPSLVIAGLVLLGISLFISSKTDKSLFSQKPLARIEQGLGQAFVFRKNMTVKEKLVRKNFLYHLDTIETAADGDAVIEFDSAYRIRMLENTLVTIENDRGKTTLILKRGDLRVENYGQEGTVYISVNGSRWNATDYEMVYKKQARNEAFPETTSSSSPSPSTSTKPSTTGLSPEYVQDVLKSQRNSFFKCYTQLLQRTPGVVGQATLSFTIAKTGKVTQPTVSSSNINDQAFRKCLTEALTRIEFKSFSGEPITTLFPLKFE